MGKRETLDVEVHHASALRDGSSLGENVDPRTAEPEARADVCTEQLSQESSHACLESRQVPLHAGVGALGGVEVGSRLACLEMRVKCTTQRELFATEVPCPVGAGLPDRADDVAALAQPEHAAYVDTEALLQLPAQGRSAGSMPARVTRSKDACRGAIRACAHGSLNVPRQGNLVYSRRVVFSSTVARHFARGALACATATSVAFANERAAHAEDATKLRAENVHLEDDKDGATTIAEAPLDAPPPAPRKKNGFILDATLGALGAIGALKDVAPVAPHFRLLFGYEPFSWLLVFVEGELAFTSTANAQDPPYTRAFPIWGFGAGVRGTIPLGDRLGLYVEPAFGAMTADVAKNALYILGFRNAEHLAPFFGGRLGVEWYQLDRHFALGVAGGARLATGFSRVGLNADTPALWEAQATLRYHF